MDMFMNMNAIVTGATKGIGRSIVFSLLKEGWNVAVTSRHIGDLEDLRKEVFQSYPDQQCHIHAVDFRKKNETIEYGRTMNALWPEKIDLLVNNVGIFFPDSVHKEGDDALELMMETNLYSAYHLTREIIPGMMARRKGYVINMCSIASFMAYPNGGSYTISKFGMLGFSKVLREEMKPYDIKVTSMMLGSTWTDSWSGADFPDDRLMKPEDIAEVVMSMLRMSPQSVVEEIIIRPQLGDLP
jgi:short-subunit dehydrogenase